MASRLRRALSAATCLAVVLGGAGMVVPATAAAAPPATVLFDQSFTRSGLEVGVAVGKRALTNSSNADTACLTASRDTTARPLPGCSATTSDADGSGAMRLNGAASNTGGGVMALTGLPTSAGLDLSFVAHQYGSTGNGGDGIAFMLVAADPADPRPPTRLGPLGGSLGYAKKNTSIGVAYGYLGIGLDAYGNFSNTTSDGSTCGSRPYIRNNGAVPGQVIVRGPGNGTTGYCALASTATTTSSPPLALRGATRAQSAVPVRVLVNTTDLPRVYPFGTVAARSWALAFRPVGGSQRVLSGALPSATAAGFPTSWLDANGVPKQLTFGWAAGTGVANDVHEVQLASATTLSPVPTLSMTQNYLGQRYAGGAGRVQSVVTVGAGVDEAGAVSATTTLGPDMTFTGSDSAGWSCTGQGTRTSTCSTTTSGFAAGSALPALTLATTNTVDLTDAQLAAVSGSASAADAASAFVDRTAIVPLPATDTLSSTGFSPLPQSVVVSHPAGATLSLLAGNDPAASVSFAGQGQWDMDTGSGVITFTPDVGFLGTVTPVRYRAVDAAGQIAFGRVSATVMAPPPPAPADLTSSGQGRQRQVVLPSVPRGSTLEVSPGAVTGGTYSYDSVSGELRFDPDLGFTGTAPSLAFTLRDGYHQTGSAAWTPTVTAPPAPDLADLTSTGTGPSVQQVVVAVPAGVTLDIVSGASDPGHGSYSLSGAQVSFTPVTGWTGTAHPVTLRLTDAYAQTVLVTYTPTVVAPGAPTAAALSTSGVAPDPQTQQLPSSVASVGLLAPTTTANGTFTLAAGTRIATFTPAAGWFGSESVTYVVTDSYGQTASGSWTVTVSAPAPPTAGNLTSSGTGMAPQTVTITLPNGTTLALVDASPAPLQGSYVLDATAGTLTFTPALGFAGTADGATFTVGDIYGQTGVGSYTPSVAAPPAPSAPDRSSSAEGTAVQQVTVTVPAAGSLEVLPSTTGRGAFTADTATGALTYTPADDRADSAEAQYRVTDAYGQTATATWTVTVTAAPAPPAPAPTAGPTPDPTNTTDEPDPTPTLTPTATPTVTPTPTAAPTTSTPSATPTPTATPTLLSPSAAPTSPAAPPSLSPSASTEPSPEPPPQAPPAAASPVAPTLASTGTATQRQRVRVRVPSGGALRLIGAQGPVTSLVLPGVATFTVVDDGLLVTPALGFVGPTPAVTYQVADAGGRTATGTLIASVRPPVAPEPMPLSSGGRPGVVQRRPVVLPPGGALTLVGNDGRPATTIVVDGGWYDVDALAGVLRYQPFGPGHGAARAVRYRVTDAYAQVGESTYTAVVSRDALAAPRTADVGLRRPAWAGSRAPFVATCTASTGPVSGCTVVLWATVGRAERVIGRATARARGGSDSLDVTISLSTSGRELDGDLTRRSVHATAVVRPVAGRSALPARSPLLPQALGSERLLRVYFATGSAVVPAVDVARLLRWKRHAPLLGTAQCIGSTDDRLRTSSNDRLGLARARAVCTLLTQGTRLRSVTLSVGEQQPLVPGTTPAARAGNRRVDVRLVG